jgi:hypothetical protein
MPVTDLPPGLVFLQMSRIGKHDASEFAGRRRGDHLAAKSSFRKKRQSATMIQVSVGQQQEIDRRGIEVEGGRIFFGQLPTSLEHAAIDEDAPVRAFEHVAGAGHASIGAVEGQFHRESPSWPQASGRAVCRR